MWIAKSQRGEVNIATLLPAAFMAINVHCLNKENLKSNYEN